MKGEPKKKEVDMGLYIPISWKVTVKVGCSERVIQRDSVIKRALAIASASLEAGKRASRSLANQRNGL
jgi:hypothetical protein